MRTELQQRRMTFVLWEAGKELTELERGDEQAKLEAGTGGEPWNRALAISATIGFAADLIGLSLCAASYPGILPGSILLNVAGTWLIACGLPFIFFAAHCLDMMDQKRNRKNAKG